MTRIVLGLFLDFLQYGLGDIFDAIGIYQDCVKCVSFGFLVTFRV